MRRRTQLFLVAGGATAALVGGAVVRSRFGDGGSEGPVPDADAIFTAYAPGGPQSYWCNGPLGRITAKLMPIVEKGVYAAVAEMIDLQPEDALLDIGCGPGAFLATKAKAVGVIVGLDPSEVMQREAHRRLEDRLADGTARLVVGSAADLPFEDGEFSAVTAIFAPLKPSEAFRVLRPGGRVVLADPSPRRTADEAASGWDVLRWGEADYRRMLEEAGFTDVATRYRGSPPIAGELLVFARKPAA